jgi:predicted permease
MDLHDYVRRRLADAPPVGARDGDADRDLIEELAQHLGDLYHEARSSGLDHEQAWARATAALPDGARLPMGIPSHGHRPPPPPAYQSAAGAAHSRRSLMLSDVARDVRYALRLLANAPAFTLVVVLTLALGIGANAAMFSAVDAILLRAAPVADPSRAISVYTSSSDGRTPFSSSSYPDYVDLRDSGAVEGLAASSPIAVAFEGREASEQVVGELVSGNYFDVLGVRPAFGRAFVAAEDRAGSPVRVVVVSNAFWQRSLGADPAAVGRDIRLNGAVYSVIGVMPAGFAGPLLGRATDLWTPMALQQELRPPTAGVRRQLGHANLLIARELRWMNLFGRMKPDQDVTQASALLGVVADRLARQYPDSNGGRRATVVRLGEGPGVRSAIRPMLLVLSGAAAAVLLIACANVAGLLAARAVSRRREVAIRVAVGAGQARLVRQWFTESMLLALLGSAGALLVARWFTPLLYKFGIPESIPLVLDVRVFLFTLLAGIGSGVLFGLAPVLQARRDTITALRDEGGAVASGVRAVRLRSTFVVLQVALSLLLLVGAGLFLRTLRNAYTVDLGYRTEGVLLAEVNLDLRGYGADAGQETYRRIFERVGALPGVQGIGASRVAVLSGGARTGLLSLDGQPVARDGRNGLAVRINVVNDAYLGTIGIPLLMGRSFQPTDDGRAPRVVIVSRSLAQRLWPGEDPIGRPLGNGPAAATVVGVVPDAVYANALEREPPPFYLVPLLQNYESGMTMLVRTAGDPLSILPAVRQAVREVDSQLVVARPRTLDEEFSRSVGSQALMATLVSLFGGLALLLAAIGLYGVMAHAAGQRRTEIGIRLALGATPREILRLIVGDGLRLVTVGAVLGLVATLIASRAIENQLFGVRAVDPLTYGAVVAVLATVALAACLIPARRAMRLDPVVALRNT